MKRERFDRLYRLTVLVFLCPITQLHGKTMTGLRIASDGRTFPGMFCPNAETQSQRLEAKMS